MPILNVKKAHKQKYWAQYCEKCTAYRKYANRDKRETSCIFRKRKNAELKRKYMWIWHDPIISDEPNGG